MENRWSVLSLVYMTSQVVCVTRKQVHRGSQWRNFCTDFCKYTNSPRKSQFQAFLLLRFDKLMSFSCRASVVRAIRIPFLVTTNFLIFCKHMGSSKWNGNFIFFPFLNLLGYIQPPTSSPQPPLTFLSKDSMTSAVGGSRPIRTLSQRVHWAGKSLR